MFWCFIVNSFTFHLHLHWKQKQPDPKGSDCCGCLARRRPALPGPCGPSTIGAEGLNGRVRDGYAWNPFAITTGRAFPQKCDNWVCFLSAVTFMFLWSHSSNSSLARSVALAPSKLSTNEACGLSRTFFLPSALRRRALLHRKEVIQPHLPIRLPCYDFTPIICPTLGG